MELVLSMYNLLLVGVCFFFFKQKTAYEMRISDWSSDVCSSDLMPCHHNLGDYLTAYIDGCELRAQAKGPLFRTIARGTKRLSDTPLPQANAFAMVRRRAVAAEIGTAIGNHSFRATGITTYLRSEERPVGKMCVSTVRIRG